VMIWYGIYRGLKKITVSDGGAKGINSKVF
jgi:hypothetical protein